MNLIALLKDDIVFAIRETYKLDVSADQLLINQTRKEFEGDFTLVTFPLAKALKANPVQIAETIGLWLQDHIQRIERYNVVKGFLNLSLGRESWVAFLRDLTQDLQYGTFETNAKKLMVEFSSPNTNKPLHLGHIRNILLGWSISRIAKANGYEVIKTQIINDRGIAVCKSMYAWHHYSNGETPETAGVKGDILVGKYYVLYDQKLREEYARWQKSGQANEVYELKKEGEETMEHFFRRYKNDYFNNHSHIGKATREMLLAWESGDKDIVDLWKKMNTWVYKGFDETYKALEVSFDTIYYESETYLLGKESIDKGLQKGVFYRKEDGSVWIDLSDAGLDHKILLRSDGTSVYMTQDIGTAQKRYADFGIDSMIYTVGDEQEYHFKVLFEILKRLGEPYADALYHLSYGMVDLPTGKMKSREGTVVDADDLIAEVIGEAQQASEDRGGLEHLSDQERREIYRKVGLAALKYFIIKVNPRKRMVFNPRESVDMQGQTGPYIQNAYVRIMSVIRKHTGNLVDCSDPGHIEDIERDILNTIAQYPDIVREAMQSYDPSAVANYCYTLAKAYHRFYHEVRILSAETEVLKNFRIHLSEAVARVLKKGMHLLGIEMPEYM